MADRVERLVNLTATLLDTRRPLTLDELAERLEPAYPSDKAAQRRAFERIVERLLRRVCLRFAARPDAR